jgi:hypothetical protein
MDVVSDETPDYSWHRRECRLLKKKNRLPLQADGFR